MRKLRCTGPRSFSAAHSRKECGRQEFSSAKVLCLVVTFFIAAVTSHAQTFSTLVDFDESNGSLPQSVLVQGFDGNFYGTTATGGTEGYGTVFKVTPEGTLTTLYNFCSDLGNCSDGASPTGPLAQGRDGNFYGMTFFGGSAQQGTIFKVTPDGTLTTIYNFCSRTNCSPNVSGAGDGGLVQAASGDFYGMSSGGANNGGTIFRVTPSGLLKTLYSFCALANCADGAYPKGTLVQARDGNLYGTTFDGGVFGSASNGGTIFEITPDGALTTLYSFCAQMNCTDGEQPYGSLIEAKDGNFYGTTSSGGTNDFSGTVFRITPQGTLSTIYSFCVTPDCSDGNSPMGSLMQATNGDFYGTTLGGGGSDRSEVGTIFKITSAGKLTTLHVFHRSHTDGQEPWAGLMQATNGNFYGSTQNGGLLDCTNRCGILYTLATELGPFVKTQPTFGKVGTSVIILGTDLTSATSVTFNGTAAVFSIVSATEITTTAPAGATSGAVEVVAPSGTLSSNVAFAVVP
jgi:uncharacterized repeat protein (TIGR03803 family)